MRTLVTVRERLRIARGRLREYEGRLRKLEGHLTTLRGRAEQARGRRGLRLLRVERQMRETLDATVKSIDEVTKAIEPQVRRAVDRAETLRRGIKAGIEASAAKYRRREDHCPEEVQPAIRAPARLLHAAGIRGEHGAAVRGGTGRAGTRRSPDGPWAVTRLCWASPRASAPPSSSR